MRTLLYTGCDDAYSELAKITVPRMRWYAQVHGMDFECYRKPLIDVPNGIYWTGVAGALKAFEEGYDRAVYLDVDQLITNYNSPLPEGPGFHASKDWGNDAFHPWHFSACGMVFHQDCIHLLRNVVKLEPEWREMPFPEQGPLRHEVEEFMVEELMVAHFGLADQMKSDREAHTFINIHPRRVFNAVPDQISPGNVPEPWAPGDFAAHLTMVPIDRRIAIAQEIIHAIQ